MANCELTQAELDLIARGPSPSMKYQPGGQVLIRRNPVGSKL